MSFFEWIVEKGLTTLRDRVIGKKKKTISHCLEARFPDIYPSALPPNAAWITQVCRTLKKRRTTLRKKLLQGTLLPELRKQVSQRFVDLPSVDLDGLLLLLDQGALVSIGEEVLAKQTDAGSAVLAFLTCPGKGICYCTSQRPEKEAQASTSSL